MLHRSNNCPVRKFRSLFVVAILVALSGCGDAASGESVEPVESAAPADITTCLKINPVGAVTTPPSDDCLANEVALDGFYEGADLVEFADYAPTNAGPIAVEIRTVVAALTATRDDRSLEDQQVRDERAAALEVVAQKYDEIEAAFALRAPSVESSLGADAAYIEVMTRSSWEGYFSTFFEGPTAPADSAHIVERIFVRMRGFELN